MTFLDEFARKLDLPQTEKEQVLREVSSHYFEIRDELVVDGMDPDEADREAGRRLGSPERIATELMSVHCHTSPWPSALIAAVLVPLTAVLVASVEQLVISAEWKGIIRWVEETAHWVNGIPYWFADPTLIKSESLVMAAIIVSLSIVLGTLAIYTIRHGRRPIWLAPCIISSLLTITKLPTALVHASSRYAWPGDDHAQALANVALDDMASRMAIAILAAVVIAAYWRSPRLKWIMIGVPAAYGISAWCTLYPGAGYMWPSLCLRIAGLAGWILLATRLFAYHRVSNGAYVSLFIFSYFAIGSWGVGYPPRFDPTQIYPLFQPDLLIAMVTVLAFARASTWRAKALIPLAGVLVSIPVGIVLGWPSEWDWGMGMVLYMRVGQLLCMLVVAAAYWRRARTDMRQIAR